MLFLDSRDRNKIGTEKYFDRNYGKENGMETKKMEKWRREQEDIKGNM